MRRTKVEQTFKFVLVGLISLALTTSCGMGKFESGSTSLVNSSAEDPLLRYAWHISNTGQSVFAASPATAGYDLNLAATWAAQIYGKGIWIQISDDGLEDTHEDLHDNFPYLNFSKNYTASSPYTSTTAPPQSTTDTHGTSVSGLAAAVGWNGLGSRGVAPKAHLTIANFLSSAVTQTTAKYLDQANGNFDISNMSWGTTQNSISALDTSYSSQLQSAVTNKRNGKGTIFVKAAGNDFAVLCNGSTTAYCIGNANFDGDNVLPYVIVTGAMNSQGVSASYSSVGSSLWISSFGGEFGDDSPAMITTDLSGCSKGYSESNQTSAFEKGASTENPSCNYTSIFNGTSSATPILSGAIALMLEANPQLSWREVKYILAKTATADHFATGSISHPQNTALPSGYVWEQKWITNAAQFKYHNWYGFGRVNVDAAVNMAKSFITTPVSLGTYTETNWNAAHAHTGLNLSIPDNSATGVTDTIAVSDSLKVEAVQIKVSITHPDISELALELTSPSGTKSILINARNSLTGIGNFSGDIFLSNAFYQENTAGNWTLKVIDTKSGNTGTLTDFSLNFFGGN